MCPPPWHDPVHDGARRLGCGAVAAFGSGRHRDRHAGREPHAREFDDLIGFFVNTLALRVAVRGDTDRCSIGSGGHARRAGASGSSVRAGRGDRAAARSLAAHADLPGDVRVAERP